MQATEIDLGHWSVQCEIPEEIPFGFVYRIEALWQEEGQPRYYIGKKQCWNAIKRKPLKGKKRVRRDRKPSNWRKYQGSCKALLESIEEHGDKFFSFEILEWCGSKWDLSWRELQYQVEADVLRNPEYYNGIIQVRLGRPPGEMLEATAKGE